jgi:hypothetical protein
MAVPLGTIVSLSGKTPRSWASVACMQRVSCLAFMSLKVSGVVYPCALVTWFSAIGDEPCLDVGMWMVEPDLDTDSEREMSVIHLDSILRAAHLTPIYGDNLVPCYFKHTSSLDSFAA